jgi:hypothetical protein
VTHLISFFRSLVTDPRSLRAIDETRLDWCFEAAAAKSPASRAFCHLRSILALLRALAGSLPRESALVPIAWLARRLSLFALVPAVLMTTTFFPYWFSTALPVPTVFVALLPQSVLSFFPLAWFYTLAWKGRRATPVLVAIALAFASHLLLQTLVLPIANNLYSDAIASAFRGQGAESGYQPRGMSGMLWGVFDAGRAVPTVVNAFAVARDLTFAMLAAAFALLASRISRLANARRVRWFVVPGVALAYLFGLRAVVMMPNILTTVFGQNASAVTLTLGLFAFGGIVLLALVAASVWLTPTNPSEAAPVDTEAAGTGIQP